jgi:hypothetical protein
MRLTRETLIKIARDTATQRARVSRRIICIYLTGSVLGDSPLLGGTTDIDLITIHDSEPPQPREIVRISDEIHLDISHYDQSIFHQPRHLRTDPWLGPFIYSKPLVLYDTQHWFDFIQAATGAQFFQPDYVFQRAANMAQAARKSWMDLAIDSSSPHPRRVHDFFKVLENAGNALVCLTGEGKPLAERRFLLQFPMRVHALNKPELISGLTHLVIANPAGLEETWPSWLSHWAEAYQAAGTHVDVPAQIHPGRYLYYERAANAIWTENPDAAAWLLLRSWSLAASFLKSDDPIYQNWQAACRQANLDEENFDSRMQLADQYLDQVEEALDDWGRTNGVSTLSE